ncbi:MAG: hypothetical protein ACI8UR_000981 [Natronomonas sp.]
MVGGDDVDEVFVGDEHPATTRAVDAELVEYLCRVFIALAGASFELFPVFADDVTARETPNRYHHA